MDTVMYVIATICLIGFLLGIALLFWGIGTYNDLARKRSRMLGELGSVSVHNSRADRVNPSVRRAAISGCTHELRAIKAQSSRGRSGSYNHNRSGNRNSR